MVDVERMRPGQWPVLCISFSALTQSAGWSVAIQCKIWLNLQLLPLKS